jgi:hypothetical protein
MPLIGVSGSTRAELDGEGGADLRLIEPIA